MGKHPASVQRNRHRDVGKVLRLFPEPVVSLKSSTIPDPPSEWGFPLPRTEAPLAHRGGLGSTRKSENPHPEPLWGPLFRTQGPSSSGRRLRVRRSG